MSITVGTGDPVVVWVGKEQHVAEARQAARALAEAIGLQETEVLSIATSVSELAGNLVFHTTGGGAISLEALTRGAEIGVEVVSQDEGPGIPDLEKAMQEGFSTTGGLGGGLPGVKRLMDEFEITSSAGSGTRITARKWRQCK